MLTSYAECGERAHQTQSPAPNTTHFDMDKTKEQNQQHTQQNQQQDKGQDMDAPQENEALAATKIQAGFRGYQVRKQMKNKKSSEDNKAMKRSGSGRRSDLEERSATKIQAGIRGFLVRKRQRNTTDKKA